MWACVYKNVECVELFIQYGAEVDRQSISEMVGGMEYGGRTALMVACGGEANDCVQRLVTHGAKLEITDYSGSCALEYAVSALNFEGVQILLRAGAEVEEGTAVGKRLDKSTNVPKYVKLIADTRRERLAVVQHEVLCRELEDMSKNKGSSSERKM